MKTKTLLPFFALLLPALLHAAPEPIGQVVALQGKASCRDESGTARALTVSAPIHLNDTVLTEAGAKLQMLMNDDSLISQGESSEMTIDEYLYNPSDKQENAFGAKMAKGVFRTVTGKITDLNPDRFQVQTRRATIGIRGCDIGYVIGQEEDNVLIGRIPGGRSVNVGSDQDSFETDRPRVVTIGDDGSMSNRPFTPNDMNFISNATTPEEDEGDGEEQQQTEEGQQEGDGSGEDEEGEGDGESDDGGMAGTDEEGDDGTAEEDGTAGATQDEGTADSGDSTTGDSDGGTWNDPTEDNTGVAAGSPDSTDDGTMDTGGTTPTGDTGTTAGDTTSGAGDLATSDTLQPSDPETVTEPEPEPQPSANWTGRGTEVTYAIDPNNTDMREAETVTETTLASVTRTVDGDTATMEVLYTGTRKDAETGATMDNPEHGYTYTMAYAPPAENATYTGYAAGSPGSIIENDNLHQFVRRQYSIPGGTFDQAGQPADLPALEFFGDAVGATPTANSIVKYDTVLVEHDDDYWAGNGSTDAPYFKTGTLLVNTKTQSTFFTDGTDPDNEGFGTLDNRFTYYGDEAQGIGMRDVNWDEEDGDFDGAITLAGFKETTPPGTPETGTRQWYGYMGGMVDNETTYEMDIVSSADVHSDDSADNEDRVFVRINKDGVGRNTIPNASFKVYTDPADPGDMPTDLEQTGQPDEAVFVQGNLYGGIYDSANTWFLFQGTGMDGSSGKGWSHGFWEADQETATDWFEYEGSFITGATLNSIEVDDIRHGSTRYELNTSTGPNSAYGMIIHNQDSFADVYGGAQISVSIGNGTSTWQGQYNLSNGNGVSLDIITKTLAITPGGHLQLTQASEVDSLNLNFHGSSFTATHLQKIGFTGNLVTDDSKMITGAIGSGGGDLQNNDSGNSASFGLTYGSDLAIISSSIPGPGPGPGPTPQPLSWQGDSLEATYGYYNENQESDTREMQTYTQHQLDSASKEEGTPVTLNSAFGGATRKAADDIYAGPSSYNNTFTMAYAPPEENATYTGYAESPDTSAGTVVNDNLQQFVVRQFEAGETLDEPGNPQPLPALEYMGQPQADPLMVLGPESVVQYDTVMLEYDRHYWAGTGSDDAPDYEEGVFYYNTKTASGFFVAEGHEDEGFTQVDHRFTFFGDEAQGFGMTEIYRETDGSVDDVSIAAGFLDPATPAQTAESGEEAWKGYMGGVVKQDFGPDTEWLPVGIVSSANTLGDTDHENEGRVVLEINKDGNQASTIPNAHLQAHADPANATPQDNPNYWDSTDLDVSGQPQYGAFVKENLYGGEFETPDQQWVEFWGSSQPNGKGMNWSWGHWEADKQVGTDWYNYDGTYVVGDVIDSTTFNDILSGSQVIYATGGGLNHASAQVMAMDSVYQMTGNASLNVTIGGGIAHWSGSYTMSDGMGNTFNLATAPEIPFTGNGHMQINSTTDITQCDLVIPEATFAAGDLTQIGMTGSLVGEAGEITGAIQQARGTMENGSVTAEWVMHAASDLLPQN